MISISRISLFQSMFLNYTLPTELWSLLLSKILGIAEKLICFTLEFDMDQGGSKLYNKHQDLLIHNKETYLLVNTRILCKINFFKLTFKSSKQRI